MSFKVSVILGIFSLFGLLSGCQRAVTAEIVPLALASPPVAADIAPTQPAVAVTIRPTTPPTPPPPIISITEPTATAPPSFALPSESELITSTPLPTNTPTPAPTATATPPPTFTPPSLPGTSANDHYWLRRPIADGGTVWTDKTYPYASTRSGTLRPHHGVEFDVAFGTPIYASATGTVVVAGNDLTTQFGETLNFYGNLVVIQHESRYRDQAVYTLYGHLSEIGVQVGQKVQSQQVIALSGSSGVAAGPHLHFEVRIGRNSYAATRNPVLWLYPFSEHGTIAGRIGLPNQPLAEGLLVTATRIDAKGPYKGTTSYTGNTVNTDDGWRENFVIDDLQAGYYLIQTKVGETKYKQEVWVYPLHTTYINFTGDVSNDIGQ